METTRNPTGEVIKTESAIANPIQMALQTQVRKRVVWNDSRDISLLKEIIVINPFSYKGRTRERGQLWQSVASNLNAMWDDKTDSRGCRERYNLLKIKHVKKMNTEEKASGISPTQTEVDKAMEELVNLEKESETMVSLPSDIKKEKEDAQEMRNRCLNAMTPIKRTKSEDMRDSKIRRKAETMVIIKEKMEQDLKWRREERELKEKQMEQEAELRRQEAAERTKQMELMQQQLLQQTQQMNNMMFMMMEVFKNK